jgi:glyoxylase-like metal-dependent hydrolase (beta-lactamase superfamily II)/8-oxo-dGTP pyrophosphatase MutT (NUDIX family)
MSEAAQSKEAARPKAGLRPAAAIIAIHRGDPARGEPLRVLWVRRSENNPFLGGFHSFPGGRLAREDGPIDRGPDEYLLTMARCAARETFEETGLLIGWRGTRPPLDEQQRVRREILEGKGTFREAVDRWGLSFDPSVYIPCGRWITPHFSRMRFDTNFFLIDCPQAFPPDVWPGELESGEWIDPKLAMRLWEEEKVVLAMPTLYTIRVLAEGEHDLPARLHAIPEANGIPSRYVSVRPGITMVPLRTETIPPATHTNAVIVGDGDVVIVDPGTADPEELFALDEVVQTALLPGRRVLAILLTHRHRDHLAGVEAVRRRYGAPVWGHSLVSDGARLDRELHEGDWIEIQGRHPQKLRVLETPGHSRSHVAFLEETSRTLIAGDLVSGLGTVVIDPPEGNMRDYMSSLERIQDLNVSVLVPGHGPPHRGVDRLLSALLEHRRMREGRVLRALADGPLGEDALRERVYADTPDAAPELAAKTLRAHLEKLEQEGRIRVTGGRVEVVS